MTNFQLLLNEPSEGVLVLNLSGEVDLATAGPVREAASTAAGSGQYSTLVFDLSDLSFMDSTGLHVLADAYRRMAARGGETKVICASPAIRKIFELTGLDQRLVILASRDDAFAVAA